MPDLRESREVEGAFMYLLHKRHLGVNVPAHGQDPSHLLYHAPWVKNVLEYRLANYGIKRAISERQVVSITYHCRAWSKVNVGLDYVTALIVEEFFGTTSHRTAADDERSGTTPMSFASFAQQFVEPRIVFARTNVARHRRRMVYDSPHQTPA